MDKILKNACYCKHCDTEIISHHRHDFKSCNCIEEQKQVFVDGGKDYERTICGDLADFENRTVYDDGSHEIRRNNMYWGVNFNKNGKRYPQTRWTLVKDLDTQHIEAILDLVNIDDFYREVFNDELNHRTILTHGNRN